LVAKVNRDIAKIESQAAVEKSQIWEDASQRVVEVERKAEGRRAALFEHALEQLEPLQRDLLRAGELSQALAAVLQIAVFRMRKENVLPDPGTLVRFQHIGKTFQFRVTGSDQCPVWGTDIYTSDSHLGTAAVHAGALTLGEEAVVRVSIVDMARVLIKGSLQNGVMTRDWGPYPVGYRVSRG